MASPTSAELQIVKFEEAFYSGRAGGELGGKSIKLVISQTISNMQSFQHMRIAREHELTRDML